jgi:hypothetical protein
LPAPFVLAIDVEPGPRYQLSGDPAEWEGFQRCVAHLEPWRETVLQRTGHPLVVTWFMRCDEQIAAYGHAAWALEYFGPSIEALRAHGDVFGLHVHPYEPLDDGSWRQNFRDEAALLRVIEAGVRNFEQRLGPVRYYRSGDNFQSNALVALLDALGVEYDVTMEPGRASKPYPEPDLGVTTDYRRAPRVPYRPAHDDFLRPDAVTGRRLWMVPLTMGCFDHPQELHPSSSGHRVEMMHVGFDSKFFQPFVDHELSAGKPVVAVTRTGDADWSPWLFANFDYLLGHEQVANVQFVSPADLVQRTNLTPTD